MSKPNYHTSKKFIVYKYYEKSWIPKRYYINAAPFNKIIFRFMHLQSSICMTNPDKKRRELDKNILINFSHAHSPKLFSSPLSLALQYFRGNNHLYWHKKAVTHTYWISLSLSLSLSLLFTFLIQLIWNCQFPYCCKLINFMHINFISNIR